MRKGWMPRVKMLLNALSQGQDAFEATLPPIDDVVVDYADATPEQEAEANARRFHSWVSRMDEEAGGIAFLRAFWMPVSEDRRGEKLLAALVNHPCCSSESDVIAGATTLWRAESEWPDPVPSAPHQRVQAVVELRSRGPLASPEMARSLERVLELFGGLIEAPPKAYAPACAVRFPSGSNRSRTFLGAMWILENALATPSSFGQVAAHIATDVVEKPIRADILPYLTEDWRELYGRVRSAVRHGVPHRLLVPEGVFAPASPHHNFPYGTGNGYWLPKFESSMPWTVMTQTVPIVPAGVSLLERLLKQEVEGAPTDLCTKAEAARKAKVGETTVYRWLGEGKIREYGPRKLLSLSEVKAVPRGLADKPNGLASKMRRKRTR